MTSNTHSIKRVTTLIAAVMAVSLAVLIPAGYFSISYQYLIGSLDAQVETNSLIVTGLVVANPKMWRFQEHSLMKLLERRPPGGVQEIRRIFDHQDEVIVESVNPLRPPLVSRRHTIYYAGEPIANFEISRSLFPLMVRTVVVAVVATLAGALVFVVLRILPLRAVRQAYQSLRESEEKYRSLFESMREGMALFRITHDDSGNPASFTVVDVNPACELILGMDRTKVIGRDGTDILEGALMGHLPGIIEATSTGDSLTFEMRLPTVNRFFTISAFSPEKGLFATLFEDITQRKKSGEEIQRLAYSDSLTGLPNRRLFFDRLNQVISRADRSTVKIAVLFFDLDDFKVVNDTMGHANGDKLLLQVSQRLRSCVRSSDTLARLGGDEFVVLVSYVGKELNVAHVAQNLLETVAQPYSIDGRDVYKTGSIGIAIFPDDGRDSEALVRCADIAMYAAKDRARNCYNFFSQEMNRKAHERMELETNLRHALEQEEFFLEFQPILAANDGSIVAAEALIRWQHPVWGRTMPDAFIPIAEDSGLIVPMGEWVLRTACRKLKKWQDEGLLSVRLAVNVSGRQFAERDFIDTVEKILAETDVDAHFLELELTETSLMECVDTTIRSLYRLREFGLGITIDDFGTGYSSLGYLKSFPIQRLKIDRSFVADVCNNPGDRAIVEAIIAMADKLGLLVVVEGVETAEQADFVRSLGCQNIQGFFYHRPLTEEQFVTILRSATPSEARGGTILPGALDTA